ncbi:MAG TPA: hypothetical protein VIG62_15675 [Blastocatellia bacterium]|jgi:hypothetical protein
MRRTGNNRIVLAIAVVIGLCLVSMPASAARAFQEPKSRPAPPVASRQVITGFQKRVEQYVKMREGLEEKLPKLPKESTPEQIEAHEKTFQEMVRAARAGAKPGDILTPDIARIIRATIKDEFKGAERRELRKEVLEADTKGVPLKVNYPYPEVKELLQVPATLLLRLPQLPKQIRYRFVGRHLLLMDRENHLIIDFMTNALP